MRGDPPLSSSTAEPEAAPVPAQPGEVSQWLAEWSRGDLEAVNHLMPVVYEELRTMARSCLRVRRPEHTLQATALVHELFLRLVRLEELRAQHREQFYALAGRVMRSILVDHARRTSSDKRGGKQVRVPWNEELDIAVGRPVDVDRLHQALVRLEAIDPVKASIVELRFFVGLSTVEVAKALGRSRKTVFRHWRMAKAWLLKELREPEAP